MARCHMPRTKFLMVALGWTFAVVALLGAVLALRWFVRGAVGPGRLATHLASTILCA
jgi:hypothetical protein